MRRLAVHAFLLLPSTLRVPPPNIHLRIALTFRHSWCTLTPVPELQGTTQEIAKAKATTACKALGAPCVTEDTALCFEAMNGLPGPYIKDFLGSLGHDGE